MILSMEQRRGKQKLPKFVPIEKQKLHQSQIPVILRRPVRTPQGGNQVPIRPPKPTHQRKKMNFFRPNTSTSWWPHFGPKWIRRLKQLFPSTSRVRRAVSRLIRKTMRTQRQRTSIVVRRIYKNNNIPEN